MNSSLCCPYSLQHRLWPNMMQFKHKSPTRKWRETASVRLACGIHARCFITFQLENSEGNSSSCLSSSKHGYLIFLSRSLSRNILKAITARGKLMPDVSAMVTGFKCIFILPSVSWWPRLSRGCF